MQEERKQKTPENTETVKLAVKISHFCLKLQT